MSIRSGSLLLLLSVAACAPAPTPQAPPPAPPPAPEAPVAPAPPPPAPDPIAESQQPKGHLASSAIQKVVRANFDKMIACYEAGMARNPNLGAGKIRVRLVIARDGRVSSAVHDPNRSSGSNTTLSAALEGSGNEPLLTDQGVISCVVDEFRKLTFPQPDGGIVVVTYPLIFSSS